MKVHENYLYNRKNNKLSDHITKEQDILEDNKFFLMTLEDESGKCQQIKIYHNSNASELAFNFCRDNDFDYNSMKYIKENIKKIIKKFDEPDSKIIFLDASNSSIQEVDEEENFKSEGTKKSKSSGKKIEKEKSNKSSQKKYLDKKEINSNYINLQNKDSKNIEQPINSTSGDNTIEKTNKLNNAKTEIQNSNNLKENQFTSNKIILSDLNKIKDNINIRQNKLQKVDNNDIVKKINDDNDVKNSKKNNFNNENNDAILNLNEEDNDENQLNADFNLTNKSKEFSLDYIDNYKTVTEFNLKKGSTTYSNTRNFTNSSNNNKKIVKEKKKKNKSNDTGNIKKIDHKRIISCHKKYIDKKLTDITKYHNFIKKRPYKFGINLSKEKTKSQISLSIKNNSSYAKKYDFNIFKSDVEINKKLTKDYLYYKYKKNRNIRTKIKSKPKSEKKIFLPSKLIKDNLYRNNSLNRKILNKTNITHPRNIEVNNFLITHSKDENFHNSEINTISDVHKKIESKRNKEKNNLQEKWFNLTNNLNNANFNVNNYFINYLHRHCLRSKSLTGIKKRIKKSMNKNSYNISINNIISNKNSKNKKKNINSTSEIFQKTKNGNYKKKTITTNNSFGKRNAIIKKDNSNPFRKILRKSHEKSFTENNIDSLISKTIINQGTNNKILSNNVTNTSLNNSKKTDDTTGNNNNNNCTKNINTNKKFINIDNRNYGVINKKKLYLKENLSKDNNSFPKALNPHLKAKRINTISNYNNDYYLENNYEIYKKTKLISNENKITNNNTNHNAFSSRNNKKRINNVIFNSNPGLNQYKTVNCYNGGEKSSKSKTNNKEKKTLEKKNISLRKRCGFDIFNNNKFNKKRVNKKKLGLDIKIVLNACRNNRAITIDCENSDKKKEVVKYNIVNKLFIFINKNKKTLITSHNSINKIIEKEYNSILRKTLINLIDKLFKFYKDKNYQKSFWSKNELIEKIGVIYDELSSEEIKNLINYLK